MVILFLTYPVAIHMSLLVIDYFSFSLSAQPTLSGLHDFDYPSLADPKIGLGAMPQLGSVRKIPLPSELVEQFGRILSESAMLS